MSTETKILNRYKKFIGNEVIDAFGSSYQTYETMGGNWRYDIAYKPEIEKFITVKTNVFITMLPPRYVNNFNVMYQACKYMSAYVAQYTIKKNPKLSWNEIENDLMQKMFYNHKKLVAQFERAYPPIIDANNEKYAKQNPGIVAMYKSLKARGY